MQIPEGNLHQLFGLDSTQSLNNIAFTMDQIYDEAYSVALTLGYGKDIDLNSMMFSNNVNEITHLREYSGFTKMRSLQTIYPAISFIAVYNSKLNRLMSTVGFKPQTVLELSHKIKSSYSIGKDHFLLPVNNHLIAGEGRISEKKTIMIVYYSPLSTHDQIGAILLAIDIDYLTDFFLRSDKGITQQQSFLINDNGLLLAHEDPQRVFENVAHIDYVQTIINAQNGKNNFRTSVQNKQTIVSFVPVNGLDATLVSLTPVAETLRQLKYVVIITITCSVVIFVIGTLLSLLATRRTFNPIERLLLNVGYKPKSREKNTITSQNEIDYLDEQFSRYITVSNMNESLLFNYALESLLKGKLDDEQDDLLRNNDFFVDSPYYMLCLSSISQNSFFRELSHKRKCQITHELANIINEKTMPICTGSKSLLIDDKSALCIMKLDSGKIPKGIVLAFTEIKTIFSRQYPIAFSTSISGVYDDLYSLQDAYEETRQLLQEKFFVGEGAIIFERERSVELLPYNSKLENEIWYSIQKNDVKHLQLSVEQFFTEIRKLSYEYAKLYCNQLITHLLGCSLNLFSRDKLNHHDTYAKSIDDSETIEQCEENFLKICNQLIDAQKQSSNNDFSSSVATALNLIQERFHEPDFSTKSAAQIIGLSAVYFNRIFKKETGESFSACLNKHRLNNACTYLLNSNLSMGDICKKIGFINESYFYTLFKKEYGITPQQYKRKESDEASYPDD